MRGKMNAYAGIYMAFQEEEEVINLTFKIPKIMM